MFSIFWYSSLSPTIPSLHTISGLLIGLLSVEVNLLQNPSMIVFLISSFLIFSTSEPPGGAVIFVKLIFIIFPRAWPMNLQPTCTYSLWIII